MQLSKRVGPIIWNSLGYGAGQVGLMLFSFITFPLFTRLLSKSDYGLLSLTNTTLSLTGLVVGLGLPNAVVRFASEYSIDKDRHRYLAYNTTMLAGAGAIASLGAMLFFFLGVASFQHVGRNFQPLLHAFQYVTVVLVSRSTMNIVLEFFRVGRNVQGYNLICFIQKISNLCCSILGYLAFRDLGGLLLGMAIGESAALVIGVTVAWRYGYWSRVPLLAREFWSSLRFASPLMLGGVCASFMNFGDRYFLQAYRGPAEVAGYAVAYDLCLYLQVLFATSFRLGALPEIVSRYTEGGDEEAGRFLAKAFQYFAWLLIGVGFGTIAVGRQALTVLASNRYADAGDLLPYLVPGILLSGLTFLFSSGLYLKKRTGLLSTISGAFAVINLVLDLLLIPKLGAKGAAIATLVTYSGQAIAILVISSRYLPVRFDFPSLARTAACGVLMFLAISRLSGWPGWIIPTKVVVGVLVYSLLLAVLEKQARQILRSFWSDRRVPN